MKRIAIALALLGAAPAAPPTVFGIALGQKDALPECEKSQYGYESSQQHTCYEEPAPFDGYDPSSKIIDFPLNALPSGPKSGTVTGTFDGSTVIGISFYTRGVEDQNYVLDLLVQKYGKPDVHSTDQEKTLSGSTFDSVTAIWATPAVTVSLMGTLGRIDTGLVTIDTPAGTAWRKAKLQKSAAQRTPL